MWATDINEAALKALGGEQPAIVCRKLDVRNPKEIEALAQELPQPDILFNCAGYVHHGTILDCKEEDWEFTFDLNVRSMYRTCRAFLPGMIRAGRGSIVNMSSIASSVRGVANRFVYTSSKAAVVGLTKAIAIDFVRQGIRCNGIVPGVIETPAKKGWANAEMDAAFMKLHNTPRQGLPEDIAAMATFLASDEAAYCNGALYKVDGGITASLPFVQLQRDFLLPKHLGGKA